MNIELNQSEQVKGFISFIAEQKESMAKHSKGRTAYFNYAMGAVMYAETAGEIDKSIIVEVEDDLFRYWADLKKAKKKNKPS